MVAALEYALRNACRFRVEGLPGIVPVQQQGTLELEGLGGLLDFVDVVEHEAAFHDDGPLAGRRHAARLRGCRRENEQKEGYSRQGGHGGRYTPSLEP